MITLICQTQFLFLFVHLFITFIPFLIFLSQYLFFFAFLKVYLSVIDLQCCDNCCCVVFVLMKQRDGAEHFFSLNCFLTSVEFLDVFSIRQLGRPSESQINSPLENTQVSGRRGWMGGIRIHGSLDADNLGGEPQEFKDSFLSNFILKY